METVTGRSRSMARLGVGVVSMRASDLFAGLADDRAFASAFTTCVAARAFGGVSGKVTEAAAEVAVVDTDAAAGVDVVLEETVLVVATAVVAADSGKEQMVEV